jgi:integrase
MGRLEIEAFLTHLAVKDKVAAATQNQALNAILFLYRTVLDRPIEFPLDSVRARRPKRIPTVLSREEVASLLPCLSEPYRLIGKLLYGSGLRVSEAVRMRVKDIDFEQQHLVVRDGKLAQAITTEAHFKGIANMMTLPLEEAQYRVGKAHGIARAAGYPLTFSIEPE